MQFAASMTVNLFVKLPITHPGTTGGKDFGRSGANLLWALSGTGGPSLLIHTWIAFSLVIGAIALFVQSLPSGGRRWRWASGIAALLTLRALFNGMSFMDCNKEFNPAIMAGCRLIVVTTLAVPLVRTRTTVAAESEIATDG
ncbi:hypothetical protein RCH11_003429 [Glaciihabitans sp. GrIS 2.15]|nr:hypothetical protein [Glaciihabitans sp. GrIS 2.15]